MSRVWSVIRSKFLKSIWIITFYLNFWNQGEFYLQKVVCYYSTDFIFTNLKSKFCARIRTTTQFRRLNRIEPLSPCREKVRESWRRRRHRSWRWRGYDCRGEEEQDSVGGPLRPWRSTCVTFSRRGATGCGVLRSGCIWSSCFRIRYW